MASVTSILACPKCGGEARVPVFYGYPDEGLTEEAELGLVILGGCLVTEDSPRWCCPLCKHAWGHVRLGPFPRATRTPIHCAQQQHGGRS